MTSSRAVSDFLPSRSFGRRLAVYFGLGSALLILILTYIGGQQRLHEVEDRKKLRVEYLIATLREVTLPFLIEERVAELENVYEQVASQHDVVNIQLIDDQGWLLIDGTRASDLFLAQTEEPLAFIAQDTGERQSRVDGATVSYVDPLYVGKTHYGTIRLDIDTSDLADVKWHVYQNALMLGAFFVLGTVIFSFAMANHLTRPLRKLTKAVEVAAEGDLNQSLSINTKDEVGRLARSFNLMLGNLRNRMSHLELTRRELEAITIQLDDNNKDLSQALQEARAAELAKSQFLATMSHELRTPLNGVIGMSDLLAEGDLAPEEADLVKTIRISGDNLLHIINSILDFSKLDAGQMELANQPIEIGVVLNEIEQVFQVAVANKGLEISANVSPDLPCRVLGDANRIRQVLTNLVANAVKFTNEGFVRISVSHDPKSDDHILFEIQDSGVGIPKDHCQSVFEQFTQVDSSFSRRHEGTGLGLAICKKLVELMDGRIWVESEIGEGSTFKFTMPLQPARDQNSRDGQARGDAAQDNADQSAKFSGRVLVVDDSKINRKLLNMFLTKRGISFSEAENGKDAVAQFKATPFDIVLMDVSMPVMNGLDASRAIREFEADTGRAACGIIGLTAHAAPEDKAACLEAGMDLHLSKPIKLGEVSSAISSFEHPHDMANAG